MVENALSDNDPSVVVFCSAGRSSAELEGDPFPALFDDTLDGVCELATHVRVAAPSRLLLLA
jgi:hypothetical protein